MTYWNLKIILRDLPQVKRDLFRADLIYFEADIKNTLYDELCRLKNDRNLLNKLAKKVDLSRVTSEFMQNTLEIMLNLPFELVKTGFDQYENECYGTVSFHDKYFEIWRNIREANPFLGILANKMTTKVGIREKIGKEVIKTYKPKSYEMQETET